ncbi:hypothetical protein F5Y17DRAFT_434952 [Xylariaceae sp. FL0594]|nr:hypothetical protein F5Y17DRAFT_434952 [Xylariaceae sp. FL0594]
MGETPGSRMLSKGEILAELMPVSDVLSKDKDLDKAIRMIRALSGKEGGGGRARAGRRVEPSATAAAPVKPDGWHPEFWEMCVSLSKTAVPGSLSMDAMRSICPIGDAKWADVEEAEEAEEAHETAAAAKTRDDVQQGVEPVPAPAPFYILPKVLQPGPGSTCGFGQWRDNEGKPLPRLPGVGPGEIPLPDQMDPVKYLAPIRKEMEQWLKVELWFVRKGGREKRNKIAIRAPRWHVSGRGGQAKSDQFYGMWAFAVLFSWTRLMSAQGRFIPVIPILQQVYTQGVGLDNIRNQIRDKVGDLARKDHFFYPRDIVAISPSEMQSVRPTPPAFTGAKAGTRPAPSGKPTPASKAPKAPAEPEPARPGNVARGGAGPVWRSVGKQARASTAGRTGPAWPKPGEASKPPPSGALEAAKATGQDPAAATGAKPAWQDPAWYESGFLIALAKVPAMAIFKREEQQKLCDVFCSFVTDYKGSTPPLNGQVLDHVRHGIMGRLHELVRRRHQAEYLESYYVLAGFFTVALPETSRRIGLDPTIATTTSKARA